MGVTESRSILACLRKCSLCPMSDSQTSVYESMAERNLWVNERHVDLPNVFDDMASNGAAKKRPESHTT
jgi:hypothetical protein